MTGTYVDSSLSAKIVIVQKDGKVTYNFCDLDGSELLIEVDYTM